MNKTSIQIDAIEKSFKDGTRALQPIQLEIEPGEVVVLLGPSGCGKSTLLRIVAGLEQPTRGKVLFNHTDVTGLPPEKRDVGFVFQQYALFPTMTVAENICFGMKIKKFSKSQQHKKLEELLTLLNIEELRDRRPNQLSGGQQQRVAIARAIATEPKILLMDEPLTALDAKLKEHLRLELAQLFRKLNITTLYVTHDQVEAMAIADRIAVMNKGRIEQIDSPREIYRHPKSPFVAQFVGQVNRMQGKLIERDQHKFIDFGFVEIAYDDDLVGGMEDKDTMGVEAFIRPEDIHIGHDHGIEMEITEVMFLGERIRLIGSCNGHKLMVDVANETMVERGDMIYLYVNQEKIIFG